jgi:hypothetical protein
MRKLLVGLTVGALGLLLAPAAQSGCAGLCGSGILGIASGGGGTLEGLYHFDLDVTGVRVEVTDDPQPPETIEGHLELTLDLEEVVMTDGGPCTTMTGSGTATLEVGSDTVVVPVTAAGRPQTALTVAGMNGTSVFEAVLANDTTEPTTSCIDGTAGRYFAQFSYGEVSAA